MLKLQPQVSSCASRTEAIVDRLRYGSQLPKRISIVYCAHIDRCRETFRQSVSLDKPVDLVPRMRFYLTWCSVYSARRPLKPKLNYQILGAGVGYQYKHSRSNTHVRYA